jgi:DNA-binding Lrp family transcriptional regulator
MNKDATTRFSFLTNHARVLVCIAHDPGIRLRDIGAVVGITERAAHRIVAELIDAGYISRRRNGRRNEYTIDFDVSLREPVAHERSIGELLEILTGPSDSQLAVDHSGQSE